MKVLREIRKYQREIKLLISRSSFEKLIREIIYDLNLTRVRDQSVSSEQIFTRIQTIALKCFQKIIEFFVIEFLTNECTNSLRYFFALFMLSFTVNHLSRLF